MINGVRSLFCVFFTAMVLWIAPGQAHAAEFLVTESDCNEVGGLSWVIRQANKNPGSTVRFQAGVTFDMSTCFARPDERFGIEITAPMTIIGNHSSGEVTVDGNQGWVANDAEINPTECPRLVDGVVIRASPGLFRVGKKNADNSAVVVEISNVRFQNLPWLFDIRRNAEVIVRDSELIDIRDFNDACEKEQIIIDRGKFTASNVRMKNFWHRGGDLEDGNILNFRGAVVLDRVIASEFSRGGDRTKGAFVVASAGGTVDVVTSRFDATGGFHAFGGATVEIVNSVWTPRPRGSQFFLTETMLATGAGSTLNFEASTLRLDSYFCQTCPLQQLGGAPVWADGGAVSLESTVIGGSFPNAAEVPTIAVTKGGSFVNDVDSWVQPTSVQDATALQALDPANTLLTAAPGIPTASGPLPTSVSPIIEASGTPGVLLEIIANSFCGQANQLLSPVDGSCIFEDAFGNPRYDVVQPDTGTPYPPGTGFRDAGAVQVGHLFSNLVNYSTHLEVTGVSDMTVALHWNRPKDTAADPLLGYLVEYCVAGTTNCNVISINGPDTLTTDITGLTNGTTYSFQVSPFTAAGGAPVSNEVRGTPFGAIGTPIVTAIPGDGSVDLTWTVPDGGGRTIDSYQILFRPLGDNQWQLFEVVVAPGTSSTVDGLRNGTTYEFGVGAIAGNESGPAGTAVATPHGDLGTVDRNPDELEPAGSRQNNPKYWERQGLGNCSKTEVGDGFGSVWDLDVDASALIIKSNGTNAIWFDPEQGLYGSPSAKNISHVIICQRVW